MRIELKNARAFLVNVNARAERHGDEVEPAGDIKLRVDLPNQELAAFHPSLRIALFFHDTAAPDRDLMDKAMEDNPDYLPHLRFPNLAMPLKWTDEMVGGQLTIHHGIGGKSDLVFEDIKAKDFQLVPKAGGTVELTMSIQTKPEEKQWAKLPGLIQREVTISIQPPTEEGKQGELSDAAT